MARIPIIGFFVSKSYEQDDELVSVLLDERCEKCATNDNCPDMQPCCDEIVELLKRHDGKWKTVMCDDGYGEYTLFECDQCGSQSAQKRNYCSNCGAKME